MIRNRIPRFRNLQNLHVIPTASNILVNSKLTESESPPLIVSPSISNNNSEINMFNQNTQKSKFNKAKRRKRAKCFAAKQTQIENSSYHWYSPNYLSPAVCLPPSDKIEEVECTSEVPVEEDFEEVEVASVDADGKQEILVGFRPTKIHYLNYKKNCFFKPKIYKFDSQRTYVNCLNVQDNYSVDGDIVSEAEYEIEYETENLDQSEVQLNKVVEINVKSVTDHQSNASKDERNQAQEICIEDESSQRIYKTSIEDNADICQGQSLIQSNLDTWKSHLIGLEYLIEIQNKNKDISAKYYCVLCSEDLHAEKVPAVVVINHINGCKHTVKYLEKHFPSCGFKFSENSGYNVVLLQKISEEINKKLGFAFMCITNFDFYEKNEDKIKEIVQNASHPCEKNLKLDINTFRNAVESDLLKDVQDVVNNIFEKITMLKKNTVISECKSIPRKLEKEISSQASSQPEADPVKVATKTSLRNESIAKNKLKSPKSFLKYKGNSALSSYLKLKYTRTKFKGSKSFKGTTTKNVCDREKKLSATLNLEATKSEEAVCDLNKSDASKKVLDSKEKEMQKPTIHSKYCRKIIQVILVSSLINIYS